MSWLSSGWVGRRATGTSGTDHLAATANVFMGHLSLPGMAKAGGLEPRSGVWATHALRGVTNFGRVALQIGGIGTRKLLFLPGGFL